MRLINTLSLEFKEFVTSYIPAYAILSHRWESPENEVSFKEYKKKSKTETSGFLKIRKLCEIAQDDGLDWAWIDTCCIDKRSSAELTEAINSMFAWYRDANVCYVYMNDVDHHNSWKDSLWWTRGWTLQELIAPLDVILYGKHWQRLGAKSTLAKEMQAVTGIPQMVLLGAERRVYRSWTVAQKMSWAAGRHTTRIEDKAYCMLGLFHINMPLLYGEGEKAFERLQLQIVQKYLDESIFSWMPKANGSHLCLAFSPDNFADCGWIEPLDIGSQSILFSQAQILTPPRVTSYGIEFCTHARKLYVRKSGKSDRQDWVKQVWAVRPKTMWNKSLRYLPCILLLEQNGSTGLGYKRMGCIHLDPRGPSIDFDRHFVIGEEVKNMSFYLEFDSDFNL